MASDTANGVSWYLALPLAAKEQLGAIRHWQNLKTGVEEDIIWVKGFTPAQVDSLEVKTLLHKTVYFANGARLYRQGSLLPDRSLLSLLWTPIDRGLPVGLPAFNHNYFGLNQSIAIRLQRTENEQAPSALLVGLNALQAYADTALAIRLAPIRWVMVEEDKAMLWGTPPLPLPGRSFWQAGDFLFPAGYILELPILLDTLQEAMNPDGSHLVVWNEDGTWWTVPKQSFTSLSLASVRLNLNALP